MEKNKIYEGFELRWSDPPRTSAGCEVSIAGTTRELQTRLEQFVGAKGSHPMAARNTCVEAVAAAEEFIKRILLG